MRENARGVGEGGEEASGEVIPDPGSRLLGMLAVGLLFIPLVISFLSLSPNFLGSTVAGQPDGDTLEIQVREACSQCHGFPPPDLLPRFEWGEKVRSMFHLANLELLEKYGRPIWELDPAEVSGYFMARAPEELPTPPWGPAPVHDSIRFERSSVPGGRLIMDRPGAANVQFWDLFEDREGPEVVICDMMSGWLTWIDPKTPDMGLQPIARLNHPCHTEAVDLDQDGLLDLLVAELGDPLPSDQQLGSISFLRRVSEGEFETIRIAENLGRVADVRAADFDSDGDLDLIVAEFGWRRLGSIRLYENRSTADRILFEGRQIDPRHGSIHVPPVDLNQDGRMDFIALISQEYETIDAFLNQGNGEFEIAEIYRGPHPHWGFSGIQPVDFDGDGDLDLLATNGDTLDDMKLRHYHGLFWLENKGTFPFEVHEIDHYYGVHRAEAGDLDGDGDLDIVASSFLSELEESERRDLGLSGVVWYEQVEGRRFEKHILADLPCNFPTLDLGDFDGDGRLDVVAGNLFGTIGEDGNQPGLLEIFRQRR